MARVRKLFIRELAKASEKIGKASQKLGTEGRRRIVRVLTIVINPFLFFLGYWLFGWALFLSFEQTFDPLSQLVIGASACDINVFPCQGNQCPIDSVSGKEMGIVKVRRHLVQSSETKIFRFGTQTLEFITVENRASCDNFFSRNCDPVCSINVFVPDENSLHIKVNQVKSSKADSVYFQSHPGVTLDQLTISGTSISVELNETTIKTKAKVTSGSQPILTYNSKLTSAWLAASQSNIRVVYQNMSSITFVEVDHRATTYDAETCLVGSNVYSIPMEATMSTCTEGSFLKKIQDTFDKDNNGRVSASDFDQGLETLSKCCGASCPTVNTCSYSYTPTFIPYGESFLTLSALYQSIRNSNEYTVVPMCTKKTYLATDSSLNITDSKVISGQTNKESLKLLTDQGGIQVLLLDGVNRTNTFESASEDTKELSVTMSSAKPIMEEIRDVYANGPVDKEANPNIPDIYAVIYVKYSPFAGDFAVPETFKFVYTNVPIYLAIPPSVLQALSMGILGPKVQRYRVDVVGKGCTSGGQIAAEETGKAIFRTLLPRFRTSLYGTLVWISGENNFMNPNMVRFSKDPASNTIFTHPYKEEVGLFSLYVSVIIGASVALIILSKFSLLMSLQIEKKFKNEKARSKVLQWKKMRGEKVHRMSSVSSVSLNSVSGTNYLENPLELFDVLFIDNFRRQFSDSFTMFFNRTFYVRKKKNSSWSLFSCMKSNSTMIQPVVGNGKIFDQETTLSRFMSMYEKFCFEQNLDMIDDVSMVKKRLLMERGIRSRGTIADRVYGCHWKTPLDVMGGILSQTDDRKKKRHSKTAPQYDYSKIIQSLNLKDATLSLAMEEDKVGDVEVLTRHLIQVFVNTFCIQTGNIRDFVAFDNRYSDDDEELIGFSNAFFNFASELKLETDIPGFSLENISLKDDDFASVGFQRKQVRIEALNGLRFLSNEGTEIKRYSFRWYALQYVETLLHQVGFAVGPWFVLQIVISIQTTHAETVGPTNSMQQQDFLVLAFEQHLRNLFISNILYYTAIVVAATIATSYFLLILVYLEASQNVFLKLAINKLYAVLFTASLFLFLTISVTQCVWVLLAAFLRPTTLLPFGVCLGSFFSVISYQYHRIMSIKERCEEVFNDIFNKKMRGRIIEAMSLRRNLMAGAQQGILAITESDESYKFDPNDLFNLIDTERVSYENDTDTECKIPKTDSKIDETLESQLNSDNQLSREEFDRLFDTLDINTLPNKRDMLFALCDASKGSSVPDGYISREEFLEAWDILVEELRSSILRGSFGLSGFQISVYLLSLSVLLILLFIFLLSTTAIFKSGGSISALIQSFLIAGATSASASVSNTFGAAASATNLASSENLENILNKEVDNRIEPEVEESQSN